MGERKGVEGQGVCVNFLENNYYSHSMRQLSLVWAHCTAEQGIAVQEIRGGS